MVKESDFRDGVSVVIPFYNEEGYVGRTFESWLTQDEAPAQIILVDNASTDKSVEELHEVMGRYSETKIQVIWMSEPTPGKTYALATGIKEVRYSIVATADADVIYPPHYLKLARELFSQNSDDLHAVMAMYLEGNPCSNENVKRRQKILKASLLHKKKCHTGGAGQIFKTHALLNAGGFDAKIWKYTLLDHEIMHRIHKSGRSVYHIDLWLIHTDRRKNRKSVRWGLLDRLLYRYSPHFLEGWFFYSILKKRKMNQNRLREQCWNLEKEKG